MKDLNANKNKEIANNFLDQIIEAAAQDDAYLKDYWISKAQGEKAIGDSSKHKEERTEPVISENNEEDRSINESDSESNWNRLLVNFPSLLPIRSGYSCNRFSSIKSKDSQIKTMRRRNL